MKKTRRLKRMQRAQKRKKAPTLNMVSLMDIFTILVFFLLVNSAQTQELDKPENIELPSSVAQEKPEQTVVVMVTANEVLLRGKVIAKAESIIAQEDRVVAEIKQALQAEAEKALGLTEKSKEKAREITIMGDRKIPFKLLKKVMASATAAGYNKISLAVIQKAQKSA